MPFNKKIMTNKVLKSANAARHTSYVKNFPLAILLAALFFFSNDSMGQKKNAAAKQNREYIALRVYHAGAADQLENIEQYLQASLLPSLDKGGFRKIGVFRAIDSDTAADKRIYVLIPFQSITQLEQLTSLTDKSIEDSARARAYTRAGHKAPSFTRMETILLRAFAGMPQVKASGVKGNLNDRVYELRSYESATEAQHQNKVEMFNEGEVQLFDRLGFNAVFYGQVLAGSRMPNLMYITSFENKAARDEHWKAFGSDPEWKSMSSMPKYQNNVSKIDIIYLRPTAYSKL